MTWIAGVTLLAALWTAIAYQGEMRGWRWGQRRVYPSINPITGEKVMRETD